MTVQINQVSVKNLGPISNLGMDLGSFNLIHGQNESGKTFLVEFLLASLFKDASSWSLRDMSGQGRVLGPGLDEEPVGSSPDTENKLEDYWVKNKSGLPLNMARLLVVKGGQAAISPKTAGGVARKELKQVLSQDALLDLILGQFKSTIQDAKVIDGVFSGDKRGKIGKRERDLKEYQRQINLLNKVHTNYSAGDLCAMEQGKEKLKADLNQQHQAKRNKAYLIDKELTELKKQREKIDNDDLQKLHDLLSKERDIQSDIDDLHSELERRKNDSKHYQWLSEAVSIWQSMSLDESKQTGRMLPTISNAAILIGFILAVSGSLMSQSQGFVVGIIIPIIFGVVFYLVGAILLFIWARRVRNWINSAINTKERIEIQETFQRYFGWSPLGLADLRTQLERVKIASIQAEELDRRLEDIKDKRKQYVNDIDRLFWTITGDDHLTQDVWREKLDQLKKNCSELDNQISSQQLDLKGLGIQEKNYRAQFVEVAYDQDKEDKLISDLNDIEEQLSSIKVELQDLEGEVRGVTGDPVGTPWATLVYHLQDACHKAAEDYRDVTAHILAGIGLSDVLAEIREQEDREIQQALRSPEVIHTLNTITKNYDELYMQGDRVIASGKYGQFSLDNISTGAQEQVQLALRMGLARRLTSDVPLFMILDDAFQHSDYDRRDRLFDLIIDMVDAGWQMIYLTMDDHIKSLAQQKGKARLGGKFREFCI